MVMMIATSKVVVAVAAHIRLTNQTSYIVLVVVIMGHTGMNHDDSPS